MDRLYALAAKHKIRVVEDAALAIGSAWKGRKIGSFGDLVTFSFHPNKNMTTIEGGALVVNDAGEAALVEELRFHGIRRLDDGTRDVEHAGAKYNFSDVSARLGLEQLAHLDQWCEQRRRLADHYFAHFKTDPACALPAHAYPGEHQGHSWNMFCVLLPLDRMSITRRQFIDEMGKRGIGIGVSYEAMHLSTLYRDEGHCEGEFPNAERIARETVTLPLFPAMTLDDVDRVCDEVANVVGQYAVKAA